MGNGYILEWDGRQLVGMCYGEGDESSLSPYGDPIYFTYNADGIRTHVQQLDWDTYYTVNGGMILEEQKQYCGTPYYTMLYIYDENGAPIGIKYSVNNSTFSYYYFEKNLQGDIVGIYNEAGVKIGGYTYDAWGNFTVSVTSGVTSTESNVVWNNPFRYRGYYYDNYTGWYYLQTRYYDPEIGRFINGDSAFYPNMLGYNMFAYCYNDPVNYYDLTGEVAERIVYVALPFIDGPLPIGDLLLALVFVMSLSGHTNNQDIALPTLPPMDLPDNSIQKETIPMEPPSRQEESIPTDLPSVSIETIPMITAQWHIAEFSIIAPKKNVLLAEKGKSNVRFTKYRGLSDQQIIDIYKNPNTPKSEKKDANTELKGRGLKNKLKRKEHY